MRIILQLEHVNYLLQKNIVKLLILFWPMSYSTKSRSTQIKTGEFRLKILQGLCIKNRNAENHLLYATARTFQKPTDFIATVADKLSEASPKSYVLQLFRMKQ